MRAKYLFLVVVVAFFVSTAGTQDAASHPIHDFFFFNGPGDFNRNVFYRNKLE